MKDDKKNTRFDWLVYLVIISTLILTGAATTHAFAPLQSSATLSSVETSNPPRASGPIAPASEAPKSDFERELEKDAIPD